MSKSTDLVPLAPEQYPALDPKNTTLALLQENLGGEPITAAELARVRMPTGGATNWSVPTAEGDQPAQKLVGVVLHTSRRRAYWPSADPTGEPPTCASVDCVTGVGEPGGDCITCPMNAWGSAGNGKRGKACKEGRVVVFAREAAPLPLILVVSPGSLKAMRQYLANLAAAGCRYYEVLTELSLTAAKNRDGIAYAQLVARSLGRLDPKAVKAVTATALRFAEAVRAFQVQAEDVAANGEEV